MLLITPIAVLGSGGLVTLGLDVPLSKHSFAVAFSCLILVAIGVSGLVAINLGFTSSRFPVRVLTASLFYSLLAWTMPFLLAPEDWHLGHCCQISLAIIIISQLYKPVLMLPAFFSTTPPRDNPTTQQSNH